MLAEINYDKKLPSLESFGDCKTKEEAKNPKG